MVNGCERKSMPSFFAKVPFWTWIVAGLMCLALSLPGFLNRDRQAERQAALQGEIPTLVELQDFDAARDIGLASEVNMFVQTNPDHRFTIDAITGAGSKAVIIPVFSVYAAPSERVVTHVIFAEDMAKFDTWFSEASVGTSRMGALYEVNGAVDEAQGYRAAIRVTLRDAGLEQVDPLIVVRPFFDGRHAGLSASQRLSYGNPLVLAGSGLWLIWFGFVVWSRAKVLKQNVSRRIGEIEERSSSDGSVNLSRLGRTSKAFDAANVIRFDAANSKVGVGGTPAE